MIRKIKLYLKSIIPLSVIWQIKRFKNGRIGLDAYEAYKFKKHFMWNVFRVLDYNGISGDYVEFGSHGGKTFKLAYDQIEKRKITRKMWAFDSFEGLPGNATEVDKHPKWQKGTMATDISSFHRICKSNGIPRDAYTAVQGYYEDSLKKFGANDAPANIAIAYIDCDLYSSTQTVLEFLKPRLKHGMILAFDDYFCWSSDHLSGERKALMEFAEKNKHWNFERYRDYGWTGASFVVEKV